MDIKNICTIKEIFKAIEQSNKINKLCNNRHKNFILIKDSNNIYKWFYDWKSYKSFISIHFKKEYQTKFINKTIDLSKLTNTITIDDITYYIYMYSEI